MEGEIHLPLQASPIEISMAYRYPGERLRSLLQETKETRQSCRPLIEDPIARQRIAQAYIEVMTRKVHGIRSLSRLLSGSNPRSGGIDRHAPPERNQSANVRNRNESAPPEEPHPQGRSLQPRSRDVALLQTFPIEISPAYRCPGEGLLGENPGEVGFGPGPRSAPRVRRRLG